MLGRPRCTCQSLYGAQSAMLQHHGPQHGKTWGRWVQCSSTTSPFPTPNVRQQRWEWHSVRGSLASGLKQKSCWRGHSQAWRERGLKAVWGGGLFGEVGEAGDPAMGEGKPVPLSLPFDIQAQGHEPREEWQRGPAPGQTGSHRTGPPSSSPRLAPSHPSPPRLAQAYGSQEADPQWSGRSPALQTPISEVQNSGSIHGEEEETSPPPPRREASLLLLLSMVGRMGRGGPLQVCC